MGQRGLKWAAAIAACLCLGGVSYGADEDMKALMERVKALEAKNSTLESKLERTTSSRSEIDRAMARADASLGSVVTNPDPHGRALRIGGYLDASYQFNIGRPDTQVNRYRAYDTDSNSFNIHRAEIDFDRLPTKAGEAGFRVDVAYGTDANKAVGRTATTNSPDSLVDLQQAYIEYIAPVGNGLTVDVGKFVTTHGAQVIQSSDNINSSRSLLFTYAIPTTHTGARLSYPVLKDKWTIGAVVANGWDNNQDENSSKYFELNTTFTLNDKFTFRVSGAVSNESYESLAVGAIEAPLLEQAQIDFAADPTSPIDFTALQHSGAKLAGKLYSPGDSGDPRGLVDAVATFKPIKKLELTLNGDVGMESADLWVGGAFYAKYQFAKNWYIAGRAEYLNDRNGARTGIAQELYEGTATIDWALSDPLHMRFEYRHDHSNKSSFSGEGYVGDFSDPALYYRKKDQDTLMVQWLYKF